MWSRGQKGAIKRSNRVSWHVVYIYRVTNCLFLISQQEKRKFEAMRGMGIDRHVFGLYIISQWLKMDPLPDLFTDKVFNPNSYEKFTVVLSNDYRIMMICV